jgi:triacylglycerol lipase
LRTDRQSVWFTGHSLGGALAMLAGAHHYFEQPRRLPDGVSTYGQLRTCERLLAGLHNTAFRDRCYRFVNNNEDHHLRNYLAAFENNLATSGAHGPA